MKQSLHNNVLEDETSDRISNFELLELSTIPCCLAIDRIEVLVNRSIIYTNGILHIIFPLLYSIEFKNDWGS
jgi:hypothetical protein